MTDALNDSANHSLKGLLSALTRGGEERQSAPAGTDIQTTRSPTAVLEDDGAEQSSVVAVGVHFEGNINAPGNVYVNGTVEGNVRAARVVVGHEGQLAGDLHAQEASVSGRVTGEIWCHQVVILDTAQTEGPIHCEQIDIRPGARIMSTIQSDITEDGSVVSQESDQTHHDLSDDLDARTASEDDYPR